MSNHYCGPYALGRVAGIPEDQAAKLLREITGKRAIFGVSADHLDTALRLLPGVVTDTKWTGRSGPTVADFAKQFPAHPRYFVLYIAGHYVVYRNGKVFENRVEEVKPVTKYARRTAFVKRAWECVN